VKDEPDSCSEACITNADEGNDEYGIKCEEAIDIKEENPEATKFAPINTEPEVRLFGVCFCVYVYRFAWLQACEHVFFFAKFYVSQIIYCLKKEKFPKLCSSTSQFVLHCGFHIPF
jgi:hypothetical protein